MASAAQSERFQEALSQFGDFVLDHDDIDAILTEACRLVARGLDLDLAKVIEIERADQTGLVRAGVGWDAGVVGEAKVSLSEKSSEAFAIAKSEPVITQDIREEDRFEFPQFLLDHGVVALVNVPIFLAGRLPYGLLQVDSRKPRAFNEQDVRFLKTYAMILGPAIDRVRTASALKVSDDRLKLIENARAYVMIIADAQARITAWLGGSEAIMGWSSKEAMGKDMSIIFTDEDCRNGVPDRELAQARKDGAAADVRWHQRKDGSRVFLDGQAIAIKDRQGHVTGFLKIAQDVTKRIRTEAALRESEERLRQFGDATQDILWMRSAQTLQWQYLTPAFETIYGLTRLDALEGDNFQNWLGMILEDDRSKVLEAIDRVRDGEHMTFDYRIQRPSDGTIRWLRNTDFPITNADGQITLIGGVGHDLTELRETESRLQVLMEGIPQLVWRAAADGDWTWSSPQWSAFTGQTLEQSLGLGWIEVIYPDDREAVLLAWRNASQAGDFQVEARICHAATNEFRWFQTRAAPLRAASGIIVEWLGTSTDIDEIRTLQGRQQVLVGELQHRTRNLMAVVMATSEKTLRASANLDDFKSRFRSQLEALSRVQGFLSRLNEHNRVTFDELIDAEIKALDGAAHDITVDGPKGVRLRSSTVQTLAMALHELATNAVKYGALSQPGARLHIRWRMQRDRKDAHPWLHVEWRESGVSMPPEYSDPQHGGHGRELIEQALPYQLDAKTSFTLHSDGVHCTILLPISRN